MVAEVKRKVVMTIEQVNAGMIATSAVITVAFGGPVLAKGIRKRDRSMIGYAAMHFAGNALYMVLSPLGCVSFALISAYLAWTMLKLDHAHDAAVRALSRFK